MLQNHIEHYNEYHVLILNALPDTYSNQKFKMCTVHQNVLCIRQPCQCTEMCSEFSNLFNEIITYHGMNYTNIKLNVQCNEQYREWP